VSCLAASPWIVAERLGRAVAVAIGPGFEVTAQWVGPEEELPHRVGISATHNGRTEALLWRVPDEPMSISVADLAEVAADALRKRLTQGDRA
jgi:hypothetical protein